MNHDKEYAAAAAAAAVSVYVDAAAAAETADDTIFLDNQIDDTYHYHNIARVV